MADSSRPAGLKVGYENGNFPFGRPDAGPAVVAVKNAGVNGVYAPIDPNTAFALVTALRQLGDHPKVAVFPTGYGSDLTPAGPGAIQGRRTVLRDRLRTPGSAHRRHRAVPEVPDGSGNQRRAGQRLLQRVPGPRQAGGGTEGSRLTPHP